MLILTLYVYLMPNLPYNKQFYLLFIQQFWCFVYVRVSLVKNKSATQVRNKRGGGGDVDFIGRWPGNMFKRKYLMF